MISYLSSSIFLLSVHIPFIFVRKEPEREESYNKESTFHTTMINLTHSRNIPNVIQDCQPFLIITIHYEKTTELARPQPELFITRH